MSARTEQQNRRRDDRKIRIKDKHDNIKKKIKKPRLEGTDKIKRIASKNRKPNCLKCDGVGCLDCIYEEDKKEKKAKRPKKLFMGNYPGVPRSEIECPQCKRIGLKVCKMGPGTLFVCPECGYRIFKSRGITS
jgi:hypothetical protein